MFDNFIRKQRIRRLKLGRLISILQMLLQTPIFSTDGIKNNGFSVLGAVVTGIGYFTIMWGQIREDEDEQCVNENDQSILESTTSETKVPLLQEEIDV